MHIWWAQLDDDGWPSAEGLPAMELDRAAAMRRAEPRRRWVAARWALRGVLGGYLERDPAEIELRLGPHGKPALAAAEPSLRFTVTMEHHLRMDFSIALLAMTHGPH
jgi:phosphopantetheinyl transferase